MDSLPGTSLDGVTLLVGYLAIPQPQIGFQVPAFTYVAENAVSLMLSHCVVA